MAESRLFSTLSSELPNGRIDGYLGICTPAMPLLRYELAEPGQWEIPEFRQRQVTERERRQDRRRHIVERQLQFNQTTFPNQDDPPLVTFEVGDQVMVKNHVPRGPFAVPWIGPCTVEEVISPVMYSVNNNGRQLTYHLDHLRPAPTGNESISEESEDEEPPRPRLRITRDREQPRYQEAREEEDRPAETGVDHGPPTSGKPVHLLNAAPGYQRRRRTMRMCGERERVSGRVWRTYADARPEGLPTVPWRSTHFEPPSSRRRHNPNTRSAVREVREI